MIIFKFIVLTFLFTIASTASAREFHYPSPYEVKGEFYPTMGSSFFSFKRPFDEKVFGDLSNKRGSISATDTRKVKLSDLSLGIKEGDTAYFVNFDDKSIRKYVFKEFINILIYNEVKESVIWGRYNVLLTDDEKEFEGIKGVVSSPYRSGFVYIGRGLDFSKAEFVNVPLEKVKSKEQVPKDFLKNDRFDHLRISNYFQETLIFGWSTPYFWIPRKDKIVSGGSGALWSSGDLSSLDFIKLSNGMMLLPLANDWGQGLRLLVVYKGNKYGIIDVKEFQEWEPKLKN